MPVKWESSVFHPPLGGDGRNRDVFPLPYLKEVSGVSRDVIRSVQRRERGKNFTTRRVNMAISSLNSMWFGGGKSFKISTVDRLEALPLVQRDAIKGIIKKVKWMGPPPTNASRQGALCALRAAEASAYHEPELGVGAVVDMELDKLSLPKGATAGVDLVDQLNGPVKNMVENFEEFLLQDGSTWAGIEDAVSSVPPYNDRLLGDREGYLNFLSHLHKSGILSFTSTCRGRVGAFCVSKKPKEVEGKMISRQRLVLDCRQTNMCFRQPPHTELGSLPSLGNVRLKPDEKLYIAGADIKDCFYAVNCPRGLCDFFCLASDISFQEYSRVTRGDVDQSFQQTRICPCIKVLPMGFSWSFYLIQALHEQSVVRSLEIGRESLILEGQPAPKIEQGTCLSMPYCDNVHTMSTCKSICQDGCDRICNDLTEMGFELHEMTSADSHCSTLGGVIDGDLGQVRATHTRMWKIILAFEHIAYNRVSPTTMQKLLGHAMTLCVLNRAGMSVFRKLYDFVEKNHPPRRLFDSERREVLNFIGIVPLLFCDLRRSWCNVLTATDASPEGYGICQRSVKQEDAESLGQWNERWRFKRLPAEMWNPRKRALGGDVFSDIHTAGFAQGGLEDIDSYVDNEDFPEVSRSFLVPSLWKTVKMGKWRDSNEHITIKEGRALVLALRRLSRASHCRERSHVFFIDNLSLCFAVLKGRAHNYDLLRIMQQVGSVSLACDIGIHPRWIPSEYNIADGPSRGQICPGAFKESGCTNAKEGFESSGFRGKEGCQGGQVFEANNQGAVSVERKETDQEVAAEVAVGGETSKEPSNSPSDASSFGCGDRYFSAIKEVDEAGDEECLGGVSASIQPVPQQVQGFLRGERSSLASQLKRCRPGHGRLHGYPLPRREAGKRRRKDVGLFRIPFCGVQREDDKEQTVVERLEEGSSSLQPPSFAKASDVGDGNAASLRGCQADGPDDNGSFLDVSWARRGPRIARKACGSSSKGCRKAVCVDKCGDSRSRRTSAGQSWGLRQLASFRSLSYQVDRGSSSAMQEGVEVGQRSPIQIFNGGVQESFQCSGGQVQCEWTSSIPTPPRRCDRRPHSETSRLCRSEGSGEMADRPERAKICQDRSCPTTSPEDFAQRHQVLPVGGKERHESMARSDPCKGNSSVKLSDVLTCGDKPHRFALEIFAGSGRITTCLHEVGCKAYPIDILLFPSHNVLLPDVEQKILSWMSRGRISLIWLGMPCTTFSRARKLDGLGPGPLRSDLHLWGLPHLSYRDQSKVSDGNSLLAFMLRIIHRCQQCSIPYIVENPLTSMLWIMPTLLSFVEDFSPKFVQLDYCAYGERWKKPTQLMYNFIDLKPLQRRCKTRSNICSFTCQAHFPLRGVNNDGIFWTLIAQPYPWEFCRAFSALASTRSG